jgi:hypothetical protein
VVAPARAARCGGGPARDGPDPGASARVDPGAGGLGRRPIAGALAWTRWRLGSSTGGLTRRRCYGAGGHRRGDPNRGRSPARRPWSWPDPGPWGSSRAPPLPCVGMYPMVFAPCLQWLINCSLSLFSQAAVGGHKAPTWRRQLGPVAGHGRTQDGHDSKQDGGRWMSRERCCFR